MPKPQHQQLGDLPTPILALAEGLREAGGRALLVGGCVRDRLLGRTSKDLDIEVYGLDVRTLIKTLRTFGPVNEVGRSFGVFKLALPQLDIDISIPRRDSNSGPGHRGIAVAGDPNMSIEEASRRRDLTVNALLYDPLTHELLDPSGGLKDLNEGVLRPVDERTFLEDPLRAVRAVQFAARLEFKAHPTLHQLCEQASLEELPAERIQGEWQKLLLKSSTPSIGLALARSTRVLHRLFPEVASHEGSSPDSALDRAASGPRGDLREGQAWALMLGVWLHSRTPDEVEATLDRLWLHRWSGYRLRERTLQLTQHWQDAIQTDSHLRHLSTHCELEITLLARWAITEDPLALKALERAQQLGIQHDKPPAILLGRHLAELKIPPGPDMGRLLKAVYRLQLDGTITTLEHAKMEALHIHNKKGPA